LIGNLLDFPKSNSAKVFTEWGNEYNSGILSASAFGYGLVVINDAKIADDLLEKRPGVYNDRPSTPIFKFVEWDLNMAIMPYGDKWRKNRKICHQNFHADAAKRYYSIQYGQVEKFLKNVLHEPEEFFEHITLLSISATMLMMYGYAPETTKDPAIQAADESTKLVTTLFDFGGTIINFLPILYYVPSWVPGTKGKRTIEKVKYLAHEAKRIPWEHVAAALKNGTALPSLVTEVLERKATIGILPEEEERMSNLAHAIYSAGSDTTISSTRSFVYLMATHPEVQRIAQEEIDRVVGNDRLPEFSDRPNLPYIEAIYHELLRHSPPLPLCIPHALAEDDVYEGYFLPKGYSVMANVYAMTHNEAVYPDPFSFKPERFLDENGKMKPDSRIFAYGFGRRICAGKDVASNFMWLVIISFLTSFNIGKAKDESGNEIEIDHTYHDVGVISHKKPFKCSITPRSQKMCQLIEGSLGSERYQ